MHQFQLLSTFLFERIFPWLTLVLLLLYVYAYIFTSYVGFDFEPSDGYVEQVFVQQPHADLRVGDVLKLVGSISFADDYLPNLRQKLIEPAAPGETIRLLVERQGEEHVLDWVVPDINYGEFLDRFVDVWWLGFVFWLAGMGTLLLIRPKDLRWRLLIAFYFITAIWIVVGIGTRWGAFDSPIIMRMALWLTVPIYLHFHWHFPRSLRPLHPLVWSTLYAVFVTLAVFQWFRLVPNTLGYLGFLLALVGTVILLLVHYITRPLERHRIRNLMAAVTIAVVPSIFLTLAAAQYNIPPFGAGALFTLPIIPAAYFYAVYQRQYTEQSLRANRAISLYLFLLLLGLPGMLVVVLAMAYANFPGDEIVILFGATLFTALVSVLGFSSFQRFVEYRLLRMPLPPQQLLESYAFRITTSLTRSTLVQVLRDEILPSLLVRQSALLAIQNEQISPLYVHNISQTQLPKPDEVQDLIKTQNGTSVFRNSSEASDGKRWVNLALPLRFENKLVGVWLLGQRDPDNFYAQSEVAILQTLAAQVGVALINIEQSEHLQMLFETNIERHEAERTELAHFLHDEILRDVAILNTSLDSNAVSERFEKAYAQLNFQLRQMTSRLRPVMLNFSLHSALDEMIDDLRERMNHETAIYFEIPSSVERYPQKVEEYLFRIVQQACENVVRHANAITIRIYGHLTSHSVHISVEDDGVGFMDGEHLNLYALLVNKHYGLVGMHERAKIIGATLHIDSAPGRGTCVQVHWKSANAPQ